MKKLYLIPLLIIAVFFVTACGSSKEETIEQKICNKIDSYIQDYLDEKIDFNKLYEEFNKACEGVEEGNVICNQLEERNLQSDKTVQHASVSRLNMLCSLAKEGKLEE